MLISKLNKYLFVLDPQFNSDEARLRKTLLEGYVPEARPVVNISTVTIVDIGLTIIQVMDLVIRFNDLFSSQLINTSSMSLFLG